MTALASGIISGQTFQWTVYREGQLRRAGVIERDGDGFRPLVLRVGEGYVRLRRAPTIEAAEAAILADNNE
jgi:hypothetical protein